MHRTASQSAARHHGKRLFSPRPIVAAVHLAMAGGLIASAAWSPEVQAQQAATRSYNIAAGSLSSVLTQYAGETGIFIAGASEMAQGKQSPGVKGSHTAQSGLAALLAGTGLMAVLREDGRYELRPVPVVNRSGDVQLAPVTVMAGAEQESAWGPVKGYVAKRSATATKTDTPIIETPQSISVVTRDEMDARNARDVGEAAAYTAGIFSGIQGETTLFGGNNVQVRGFGGNGNAGVSFNEYLDGLRFRGTTFAGANLDPYVFERVEVLKGPASVLFGQTQPGGVVNMVSKRPHAGMVNEIRLGTGSHNHMETSFDVGGAMGEDFLFRVIGLRLEGGGTTEPQRPTAPAAGAIVDLGERKDLTDVAGALPGRRRRCVDSERFPGQRCVLEPEWTHLVGFP